MRASLVPRYGQDECVGPFLLIGLGCSRLRLTDTWLSTVIDAALGEIITTCSKLEWIMKHGERALRPEKRRSNLALSYKSASVHYEPLGVVAAIVSWNYRTSLLLPYCVYSTFLSSSHAHSFT